MAVRLLFILLGAGLFLDASEAQEDLSKLPENYRKGVEMAVQQINSHQTIKNVFLFFKSLDKSDVDGGFGVSYLYHQFYLKATRCPKETKDPNPSKCVFRNDRPLIDCGICYKTFGGEIESDPKPYIHCIHKPQLTKDLVKARVDHCYKMSYAKGSHTLLAARKP